MQYLRVLREVQDRVGAEISDFGFAICDWGNMAKKESQTPGASAPVAKTPPLAPADPADRAITTDSTDSTDGDRQSEIANRQSVKSGDVVCFVQDNGKIRPAEVLHAADGGDTRVSLRMLTNGYEFGPVSYDPERKPGTWHFGGAAAEVPIANRQSPIANRR